MPSPRVCGQRSQQRGGDHHRTRARTERKHLSPADRSVARPFVTAAVGTESGLRHRHHPSRRPYLLRLLLPPGASPTDQAAGGPRENEPGPAPGPRPDRARTPLGCDQVECAAVDGYAIAAARRDNAGRRHCEALEAEQVERLAVIARLQTLGRVQRPEAAHREPL